MPAAETYFIAWKGRRDGPFSLEQLADLLQKGEISLLHRVETTAGLMPLRQLLLAADPARWSSLAAGSASSRADARSPAEPFAAGTPAGFFGHYSPPPADEGGALPRHSSSHATSMTGPASTPNPPPRPAAGLAGADSGVNGEPAKAAAPASPANPFGFVPAHPAGASPSAASIAFPSLPSAAARSAPADASPLQPSALSVPGSLLPASAEDSPAVLRAYIVCGLTFLFPPLLGYAHLLANNLAAQGHAQLARRLRTLNFSLAAAGLGFWFFLWMVW